MGIGAQQVSMVISAFFFGIILVINMSNCYRGFRSKNSDVQPSFFSEFSKYLVCAMQDLSAGIGHKF